MQDAEAMKVFVFRHDQQSVVPSVGPECTIGCRRQGDVADVYGTGVQVSERRYKARREILVEK